MEKRGRFIFIKVFLILLLIVVWASFILYEQLPSLLRPSIGEKITTFYQAHPYSLEILSKLKMILIALIPLTVLVIFLKVYVFGNKKELSGINLTAIKSKSKTDLDTLYAIVQEKKELKISSISALFKIDEDLAMEWAKILEAGDLVTIEYPGFGGSIVRLNTQKEETKKPEVKIEKAQTKETSKPQVEVVSPKVAKKIEKQKKKEEKKARKLAKKASKLKKR